MLSFHDHPTRLCDGLHRRELLRVGGLSLFGLSLPHLLAAQAQASTPGRERSFGRAKNVIFLWLQGGPPQHETFDPKPDAPAEIRGEFKPIQTNVPGVHFSELLPRTAAIADKLAVVRSLCTHSDLHDGSGYWVLTGYKYTGTQSRQISPTDWPYFGSIVKVLKPSTQLPSYTSVWLPDVMRLNDNVKPAGQTAGFLGSRWEPERVICDPASTHFHVEGLSLPAEVPPLRLSDRQSLLAQVDRHLAKVETSPLLNDYDRRTQEAFSLLTSGKAREAFALEKEPAAVRERYGRGRWGQSVLLARRLVEAGARLVHVNWPREDGDSAVDNPMWDTHAQNADRLQDVLCPQFDVTFTALIEDLEHRGLLSETLVVAIGEFGRTPRINANGGRDHWGHVFSFVMAGAGIRTAQVIGSSDKIGAYPTNAKMEPQDLTATIFHLLGIGHDAFFPHPTGRPIRVTEGEPIRAILGSGPASSDRIPSTGNLALVPAYTDAPLLNVGFEEGSTLQKIGSHKRLKGWQATPLVDLQQGPQFGIWLESGSSALPNTGTQHACLGVGGQGGKALKVVQGHKALLTQEVRNPRAGKYIFSVKACGGGASAAFFRAVFLKQFQCRLLVYGFADLAKDPLKPGRVFSNTPFVPVFAAPKVGKYEDFEVAVVLRSQDGGAFDLSKGVGVAVVVEKTAPGELDWSPYGAAAAFVRIDDVTLRFIARPRDDNVLV
jgi:Protein of unknown function (DUF1501)